MLIRAAPRFRHSPRGDADDTTWVDAAALAEEAAKRATNSDAAVDGKQANQRAAAGSLYRYFPC
eukprot:gene14817-22940_t